MFYSVFVQANRRNVFHIPEFADYLPPKSEGNSMRRHFAIAAAAALLCTSSFVYAQQPAPAPVQQPSATQQPQPQPEPGANSFTESQAKSRLEGAGYSNVSALRKDEQGIWRGTAMKDGKRVNVAVDFKGNITLS
jgi:hypothetical protein